MNHRTVTERASMSRRRRLTSGGAILAWTLLALGAPASDPARAQESAAAPTFEVDPSWPKPLPKNWLMGQAAGVAVDRRDHVWVIQRPKTLTEDERGATLTPPRSVCCVPAPPVMEFDSEGKLVQAWGGPGAGYSWPANEHGIFVDHHDHVWIAGNGPKDGQLLKFTRDGRFVMKIGAPGVIGNDRDTAHLHRPANMVVDPQTNELFVADGYGNHRVIVFDAQTGAYKRHWGANGRPPGDPSVKGFGNPVHCVRLAHDGLLYVCDRQHNRIQVFRKDGVFVKELVVAPATRGNGSTWDADVSHDQAQTFLYNADGENNHVWILLRDTGRILGTLGRSGRQAGQFHWIHNLAVDSKGNLYTTEVDSGKRAQKFVFKGQGR
jgi:DNA-binding beta-propeller fold protein YncE